MAFKGWEKVVVTTDTAERVGGIAPVIISASRSTDIPGCFGDWFVNRLKRGYVVWKNPFNGQQQLISFEKTRCIVFWTKNPQPFLKHIETIQKMGIGVLFQVTVNDYENERLEMNVPSLEARADSVRTLSAMIGKECVLWRFDPLILTDTITSNLLIEKISRVGELLHQNTSRLTISFLAHYKKVVKNLKDTGLTVVEFADHQKKQIAAGIQQLNEVWNLETVSCAETLDLSDWGILHGRCIDPFRIMRCFGADQSIKELFGSVENELSGLWNPTIRFTKDPGQRASCGCVTSKDIGAYNSCAHGCVYCYANTSPVKAMCSKIKDSHADQLSVI